jgi:BR-signaling kinase
MHACVCCMQALDIMRGRNIQAVMDSHLEGNYSIEVATTLVNLASQCLQYEPRDRPDIKKLVSILEPLQKKIEVTMFIPLYFIFDSVKVFVKGVYLMS